MLKIHQIFSMCQEKVLAGFTEEMSSAAASQLKLCKKQARFILYLDIWEDLCNQPITSSPNYVRHQEKNSVTACL